MKWESEPDTFTDEDWRQLIHPNTPPIPSSPTAKPLPFGAAGRPAERQCWTHPQAVAMYRGGVYLGMIVGFAGGLMFALLLWRLTR